MSDTDVRWGILSTANIATKVRRAMKLATGADAYAVGSRSWEKAQSWAKQHDVPKSHGSYEALLEDPDLDAIYIALPPSLHHEWTIKAAEHKKHILCEKPLAVKFSQAEEMAAACRQHGVLMMDGVMWVHHDRTREMQAHLNPETIGTIRRATAAFSFNFGETVPNENIRVRKDVAGGCLGDLGWYCVRGIWWALDATPERVFATARYYNGVTFNLSAMLWFPGDLMASFDCGFDTTMRQWIEVAGTEASLICTDYVLPLREDRASWTIRRLQEDQPSVEQQHAVQNCVQEARMIEHFSAHVASGESNDHWIAEALITQRICDAIERSAATESIVELG